MARKSKSHASPKASAHKLPGAELDVLACLWQEGQATARRVREKMRRYRPMAHGSVVTLLVRLEKKGLVSKEKGPVGKAFIFKATRRPEPTFRNLLKDLLLRVFGGDMVAVLTALLETQQPTAEEAARMKQLVGKLKGKKSKAKHR